MNKKLISIFSLLHMHKYIYKSVQLKASTTGMTSMAMAAPVYQQIFFFKLGMCWHMTGFIKLLLSMVYVCLPLSIYVNKPCMTAWTSSIYFQ